METATLSIKHWGNSLGVRLPANIAKAANLFADMQVDISVEGDKVIIAPDRKAALTLEQRLALFDPKQHGGEAMMTEETIGAEEW
ncbi:MAG: AbrB/MazE/SpoVT family DNA-binding domain-containing protein [Trichlorobacter sp.]|jgi:antitoxin MazE|nr:AbrB/MazE/SpoVT family DNA-binding domain-containing protein [Trichlorobacter sp.]